MATTTAEQVKGVRRLGPRSRAGGATRSEGRLAFWLLLPAGLLMMLVVGYPVLYAVYLSLFKDKRFATAPFTGLGNYVTAFHSTQFWSDDTVNGSDAPVVPINRPCHAGRT